ncbi:Scr1 family TA system antitoxin-like transcriptional regulator [Embleya sp. NPDC050154]|uniref:helix-turn-helix domain-containing protein n=1 Tax=unclassified Embleya TaxID=2699296 RepID=UPI0037A6AC02
MILVAEMNPGSSFAALFGRRVALLRTARGMTQTELGHAADRMHYSRIGQIERALGHPPTEKQAADLDKVLGAEGLLIDLWGYLDRESFPNWVARFMELAEKATQIREYAAHAVPGLLQTEDYARALLRTVLDPEQTERQVRLRLARQKRLKSTDAPSLSVILDESVLQRPVGSREIMVTQLRHLRAMANLPEITVHVLCFAEGEHPSMGGSLSMLTLPNGSEAAYTEGADYGRLYEDPADVRRYETSFGRVQQLALPPVLSLEMLEYMAGDI